MSPRQDTRAGRSTQTLREAILSLRLRPGTRLVERDMVERGHRGVFLVAAVSAREARQIYEVRAALEPAMARLFVARASQQQIAALGDAVASAETAARALDGPAYVAAFRNFYAALLDGSGNEIARRILEMLEARIAYLRHLMTQQAPQARQLRTTALLRGIYSAVRKRAPDLAARRCAAFVERSARFAMEVLKDAG